MPKIAAANIEEHIQLQSGRILDAARDLFSENGYRGTDMGEIAKSMGLARNSLYRYYPNKDHILVAVMKRDMAPVLEQTEALKKEHPDPAERIDAWLDQQMEIVAGPCHSAIRMLGDMGEISDELKKEIHLLHEPPRAVLESSVTELLKGTERDPKYVSSMISGMVQSAGALALEGGDLKEITKELKRSASRILGAD